MMLFFLTPLEIALIWKNFPERESPTLRRERKKILQKSSEKKLFFEKFR